MQWQISQISGNIVPRNLRMTTVDMTGVGAATGAGDAIYGTGAQTGPNTGLRNYYEFGLVRAASPSPAVTLCGGH